MWQNKRPKSLGKAEEESFMPGSNKQKTIRFAYRR